MHAACSLCTTSAAPRFIKSQFGQLCDDDCLLTYQIGQCAERRETPWFRGFDQCCAGICSCLPTPDRRLTEQNPPATIPQNIG